MPTRSTTIAVVGFYVLFIAVIVGGAYLFSRSATNSSAPPSERGHESGREGTDSSSDDDDEFVYNVQNYHNWDIDSFSDMS
ncbi:hypothetical protein PG984_005380 [Apiospora sp. TS-2023a]